MDAFLGTCLLEEHGVYAEALPSLSPKFRQFVFHPPKQCIPLLHLRLLRLGFEDCTKHPLGAKRHPQPTYSGRGTLEGSKPGRTRCSAQILNFQ